MKDIIVVAKAVVFNGENVLIVRRSKTDPRRPLQWDLPGGMVEDGESHSDACSREVDEETGLKIEPDKLHLAYTHTEWVEGKGNITWLIYVARTDKTDIKLSYEHDLHEWLSLKEAIAQITYERHLLALKHIEKHAIIP